MVVWGGESWAGYPDSGGIYDPAINTWTATTTDSSPSGRQKHTAVWTGNKMIVWGGFDGNYVGTGGIYDPVADSWTSVTTTNAPSARCNHTAVWTGSKMIVWGGYNATGYLNTGRIYDPLTNIWSSITITNAPSGREMHTAIWTGIKMIIWGGINLSGPYLKTGGIYNTTDSWTSTDTTDAPTERYYHTAVWSGKKMVAWGGSGSGSSLFNTGGIYDTTDSWGPTTTTNAPSERYNHTVVWTGEKMIVWGGNGASGRLKTGGVYYNSKIIVDTTAPSAPITLTANGFNPSPWTNDSTFEINWTNPPDVSGIARALYKLGSAPTSNYDTTGSMSPAPPDTVYTTTEGGIMLYLWLEDSSSNVDYNNNSLVNLRYDITPPVIDSTTIWPDTTYAGPFEIRTKVTDNLAGLDSVLLYYMRDEDPLWEVEVMHQSGDWFTDTIPTVSLQYDTVRYYIRAIDYATNESTDSAGAPASYYSFIANMVGVEENVTTPRYFSFGLRNSPARGKVIFNLIIPEAAEVTLKIYDVSGRFIDTPIRGRKTAGVYEISWTSGGSAGVYFYSLDSRWERKTGKFILMR
jgi:hypothetical protein